MSKASIVEMETLSDGEKKQIEGDTQRRENYSAAKRGRVEEEEGRMAQTEKKEK